MNKNSNNNNNNGTIERATCPPLRIVDAFCSPSSLTHPMTAVSSSSSTSKQQ
jgi:hypothetical protein